MSREQGTERVPLAVGVRANDDDDAALLCPFPTPSPRPLATLLAAANAQQQLLPEIAARMAVKTQTQNKLQWSTAT